jgi:hypothetical protein
MDKHTITIEQVERAYIGPVAAVVERFGGVVVKLCCTADDLRSGQTLEGAARAYASTYGATYVEAVSR